MAFVLIPIALGAARSGLSLSAEYVDESGSPVLGVTSTFTETGTTGSYTLKAERASPFTGTVRLLNGATPLTSTVLNLVDWVEKIADAVLDEAVDEHLTPGSTGRALQLARAQAGGAWTITGDTLTLYDLDNTTVLKTFTLAPSGGPFTSRTAEAE